MAQTFEIADGRPEPIHGPRGRKRVLVFVPTYLPGYKSGGPIRAIANMVESLSAYFDFYIVTRDRDATDTQTYRDVTPNLWYRVGSAKVLYCSSIGSGVLRRAFRQVRPDLINLNSFYDTFTRAAVLLHRVGVFGDTPIIVAPRGEFSPGAMRIRRIKKTLYRRTAKFLGLYADLLWQASAPREKQEILQGVPVRALDPDAIHVVRELSDAMHQSAPRPLKYSGSVRLAFISRISEKKNLDFLLEILPEVRGKVELNLFGPVAEKDSAYWEKCQALLARLPDHIEVRYRGSLDHAAVPEVLHEHHFFVLPTKGENFCHALVESLVNGTPVVVSDETPWSGIYEARAGFEVSLNDRAGWRSALQTCLDMDEQTYAEFLSGARQYGSRFSTEEAVKQHLKMFEAALQDRRPTPCPTR